MIGYEIVTCGVYMIKNKKTGQMYVGQSKNIEQRLRKHCNISSVDMAIAIEGVENFDFNIIEEVNDESLLLKQEKFWIRYYGVEEIERHYNTGCGKNPNSWINLDSSKYTLWNGIYCHYFKGNMTRDNRSPNPCKCFGFRFQKVHISIGIFHDFISVEIINQLVQEAIESETK